MTSPRSSSWSRWRSPKRAISHDSATQSKVREALAAGLFGFRWMSLPWVMRERAEIQAPNGPGNVSVPAHNIVNLFTPYGHPDLLRQTLVAGMAAHLGNLDQLAWLLDLVTSNPAGAPRRADLVALDARSPERAVTEQAETLWVIKGGRITARKVRTNELRIPSSADPGAPS